MTNSNSAFVGSIPEYYDRYLGPLIFEAYSIDIASRLNVPPDGKVLEIAAGTGLASSHLKKAMSYETEFTVTDLNQPMLEIAQLKFDDKTNMHFQTANALELPFPDASFDAVVCQFGIMFFPDKQKGAKEAWRVLKPGGEYIVSVWDSLANNPMMDLINNCLKSLFPKSPPPFLEVPFHFHNIDEIVRILDVAGFNDIDIAVLPRQINTNHAKNPPFGFIKGNPLSLQIPALGGNVNDVIEYIENEITIEYGLPPIIAPMKAIVFKAHK